MVKTLALKIISCYNKSIGSMNELESKALEAARTPGPVTCPESGETLWAPMDKLSIALYGKSTYCLEDNSPEEKRLLELIEQL